MQLPTIYGFAPAETDGPERFQLQLYAELIKLLAASNGEFVAKDVLEISCGRGGGFRHLIGLLPVQVMGLVWISRSMPFNGIDDGLTGRSIASLDFALDFLIFRPTLAINGGGVYGKGVQDGFVAGPEIRFDIAPYGGFNFGIKAA